MALGQRAPASDSGAQVVLTLRCLANGFIVTSLLWGAALASLLDGRSGKAAIYFLVAAGCALFGIIHSPLASAPMGMPWHITAQLPPEAQLQSPYHWAAAYVLMAALVLGLGLMTGPPGVNEAEKT
jgi:AGZA family xanthine/uracil permease-like MFS transporter